MKINHIKYLSNHNLKVDNIKINVDISTLHINYKLPNNILLKC